MSGEPGVVLIDPTLTLPTVNEPLTPAAETLTTTSAAAAAIAASVILLNLLPFPRRRPRPTLTYLDPRSLRD